RHAGARLATLERGLSELRWDSRREAAFRARLAAARAGDGTRGRIPPTQRARRQRRAALAAFIRSAEFEHPGRHNPKFDSSAFELE
ncbi:MAG TPA: hypothetical protein VK701_04320, partial [Solirubrobacteraceae bacterium]|nr:hypothetical protein [Solirubrobacteraceae bacterium]